MRFAVLGFTWFGVLGGGNCSVGFLMVCWLGFSGFVG